MPSIIREVMLCIGDPGTGKSLGALTIARDNPDKLFHYVVADRPIDRLWEHFGDKPLPNVIEYESFNVEAAVSNILQIVEIAKADNGGANHWAVIDTIGQLYKYASDAYTLHRYGKLADQLVEERTIDFRTRSMFKQTENPETKGLYAGFQGWEWSIIAGHFYNDIVFPILRQSKINVYMIAHPVALRGMGPNGQFVRAVPEIAGIKSRFEAAQCVPDLHKQVVRYVDTILYFSRDGGSNTHYLYTIKETGRRQWLNEDTPFTDFWTDYRQKVMGQP